MNIQPHLQYYGDIKKAQALKGQALAFWNLTLTAMSDIQSIQRDKHIVDAVIRVNISTSPYGEKQGVIQVFVPDGGGEEFDVYITYTDLKSPPLNTYPYETAYLPPFYRDKFTHVDRRLISQEPKPPDPPNRPMDLPRFNPTINKKYYAGQGYWYNFDEKTCISHDTESVYKDGKRWLIFLNIFLERIVCCCYTGEKFIIISINIDDAKLNLNVYDIDSGKIIHRMELIIPSYYGGQYHDGSFLNDAKTLIYNVYRGDKIYRIVFNDNYTNYNIDEYSISGEGGESIEHAAEYGFFSEKNRHIACHSYAIEIIPHVVSPPDPPKSYTETRRYPQPDGSVIIYGYSTVVQDYHLNSYQFYPGESKKTLWVIFYVKADKKSFTKITTRTYTDTHDVDNHVNKIIHGGAVKGISSSGVESEWMDGNSPDTPPSVDNSSVILTSNYRIIYPVFKNKKIDVIIDNHVYVVGDVIVGTVSNVTTSKITINNDVIYSSNIHIFPITSAAFDETMLIFCFEYFPNGGDNASETRTMIINTKTKQTQIIDYAVDSVDHPVSGKLVYPLSVTSRPPKEG